MKTTVALTFTWGIVPAGTQVQPVPKREWEPWVEATIRESSKHGVDKRAVRVSGRVVAVESRFLGGT